MPGGMPTKPDEGLARFGTGTGIGTEAMPTKSSFGAAFAGIPQLDKST